MRTVTGAWMVALLSLAVASGAVAQVPSTSADKKPAAEKRPAVGEAAVVRVRGTVAAVDKDNRTITLKGPKGRTITLDVQDPSKLEVVKVGDPVVAAYMEAVAIQVKKAGAATPGVSVEQSRVSSKPGETPAGAWRAHTSKGLPSSGPSRWTNASSCTSTVLSFVSRAAIETFSTCPWSARYSHAVVANRTSKWRVK